MPPLLRDQRHFDLRYDELVERAPAAIAKAFAEPVTKGEDGSWRLSMDHGGVINDVTMRVEGTASGGTVHLEVAARRGPGNAATQAAATVGTMVAWVIAGVLTFGDFMGRQDPLRIAAWVGSLAVAFLLTALLIRRARIDATAALAPMDRLWRALDELEARPRIGGYRIAPEPVKRPAEEVDEELAEEAEARAEESERRRHKTR